MNLEDFANAFSKPTEKIPEALKSWLVQRNYWEKEYDTLLHFHFKIDDEKIPASKLQSTTMCRIHVKADEKGFYIEGRKILDWTDKHVQKDGNFFYESDNNKYIFGSDEIICYFADSMIGIILSNLPDNFIGHLDEVADLGAEGLYLWIKEIWGNKVDRWNECEEILSIPDAQILYRNQVLPTSTSLYFSEENDELAKWKDYVLYDYRDRELKLVKRSSFLTALKNNTPIARVIEDNHINIKSNSISFNKRTISFGFTLFDKEQLDLGNYITNIKPSYSSLIKNKANIESEASLYEIQGHSQHAKVNIEYSKTKGEFYKLVISVFVYVVKTEDEEIIELPLPGFEKNPLKIELSNGQNLTLEKNQFIDNEKNPGFNGCFILYRVSRKQLRRIVNSKKMKMVLTGDNTTWTLKADDQIESFKNFEKELFESPQYVLDYFDAENAYDDGNYKLAAQKIKSAINAKPENIYFKKLNQDIIAAREIILAKDFANAKALLAQKKYEQALNAGKDLVSESDKPEYKEFIDKVKNEWANVSFSEAQKEFTSSAYETAYEKIEHALSLRTDNEYESLKNKILEALEPYLKKKYTRLIQDDKVSKAVACAEKAHNIFPNSSWASNALDEAKKKRQNKRLTLAGIVGGFLLVVLIVFSISNDSNNKTTRHNTNISNSQSTNAEIITETAQQSNNSNNLEVVNTANDSRYKTKDLQTFGLYGQVKTVHERRIDSDENGTPSPNSYYMEDYYEFSSAGEAILDGTAKRNQQGYLSSQENDVSSDAWFIKEWTYSADGNVLVFKHSTIGGDTELHYSYDNEGNISMSLSQGMSEEGDEFDVRVHYYIKEKDNQGNWTKLLQKEVTTFGGTQEIEYYFVTRDITYYY